MFNYLIIPIETGFVLQIGSGKLETRYTVRRYIEAIGILQLIGLPIRPMDKKASVSTLDYSYLDSVDIIGTVENIDTEITAKLNIIDLKVA